MKAILSSRRDHYLAKFSIFLITVALIAGVVGCVGDQYILTILRTEGGKVTSPGVGNFTYTYLDEEIVVNLMAEPDECYRFVNWSGDVDTIADAEDATTNITMDGDYSITANFILEILEIQTWNDLDSVRDKLGCHYLLMNNLELEVNVISTTPSMKDRNSDFSRFTAYITTDLDENRIYKAINVDSVVRVDLIRLDYSSYLEKDSTKQIQFVLK